MEAAEATARISQIVKKIATAKANANANGDIDAGTALNAVATICQALHSTPSTIDIISALDGPVRSRLESLALQHFRRRLLARPGNRAQKTHRPAAELHSASKAWRLPPVVLLIEFADAPVSDNFWRLLSRLARSTSDWKTAREQLLEQRQRRHGLLARRQGLSSTQSWTIADIQAVLQRGTDIKTRAKTKEGVDESDNEVTPEDIPLHAGSSYDSEGSNAWSLSFGWWLSEDVIHLLCSTLLQSRPEYLIASNNPIANKPADTVFLPINTKLSMNWSLAVFSSKDRIISLYDTLQGRRAPGLGAVSSIESTFYTLFPSESFSTWSMVRRSCPLLQNGADSGVVVVALILYYCCGRAMPLSTDFSCWLWRRILSVYVARLPSSIPADIDMAVEMAAGVTELYRLEIERNASRRTAIRDIVAEARAVWLKVIDMADELGFAKDAMAYSLADLDRLYFWLVNSS